MLFFAEKKEIVDISILVILLAYMTLKFKIGDTLTEGNHEFQRNSKFSPEHFRYINNADPMKAKQLTKGLKLMDEGVAQLFTLEMNNRKIIGTVGALQYEVIQYRLEHEYGKMYV
jgi:peptide chain release factor 3